MWKHSFKWGLATLLGLAAAAPALTQQTSSFLPQPATRTEQASATPPVQAGDGVLTKADVDTWLDGYMPYALGRGDVAGAVVVVVKDGQVLTQRGFGYADVAKRKPVDPATTLFRPGSTSKLFTWTAVMQQVEAGKIDLDADVNNYLDFKMPPYKGKPITMRQIMTHTAGFEEIIKNLLTFDKPLKSLGDTLKDRIPERIFEPGSTPAYSNYATALAGYIVERVSGVPFDDYVERNIFQRIGMRHASFRQPLPANLKPYMSQGYELGSGKAERYEEIGLAPAGAMAASGADMAKFMIAHLNGGAPLLKPETERLMQAAQNKSVPGLNQMALGFYEQWIDGHRALAHGGDTVYFHSDLLIFPVEKVGIFISMNSPGKEGAAGAIRGTLMDEFVDRYLSPGPRPVPVELSTAKAHAKLLVGNWSNSRRVESSFASIVYLLGEAKIGLDADGRPSIPSVPSLGGAPRKWIEVAPFVWQDAYGHERVAAQVVDGKVVRWSFNMVSPFMVFDRTPWYATGAWLIPGLLFGIGVVLLTALSWPVGWFARRRYGAVLALTGQDRHAYRLVRGFAWLVMAVLVGWAAVVMSVENFDAHAALDLPILLLQILGTIGFIGLFALAAWSMWRVWKGKRGWFGKLWSLLLLLGAFFILWVAVVFKLISFGTAFLTMVHRLTLDVRAENFAYAKPFRIAGHVFLQSPVVEVRLSDGLHVGRGEGGGVFYLNDDVAAMTAAIEHARAAIEGGLSRAALQALPPGGGRNALDCALWELESKASGVPVWKLAGLSPPRPLRTTFTLGADDPAVMARGAVETFPDARALKLKLTGDLDLDIVRVEAVRAARPDCWIGVDANQGYAIADLAALVRAMERWDIRLIEQPLARGREADLDGFASPIPIAADESILSLADIEAMPGRFDVVNIKLDKCGGLTEALAMARRARALGLGGVMVGNMMGTSLATAPAYLVGQYCDVVDLDGPTFLAADRQPGIAYRDGDIECSDDAVWGHLAA